MKPLGEITDVAFHESLSSRESTTLEQIEGWHLAKGWNRIGYHYVIEDAPAIVRPALPLTTLGVHVKDGNTGRIGVCITGDNTKPAERWSAAQVLEAYKLLLALQRVYPGIGFGGHCDYDAERSCPDVDVRYLFRIVAEVRLSRYDQFLRG